MASIEGLSLPAGSSLINRIYSVLEYLLLCSSSSLTDLFILLAFGGYSVHFIGSGSTGRVITSTDCKTHGKWTVGYMGVLVQKPLAWLSGLLSLSLPDERPRVVKCLVFRGSFFKFFAEECLLQKATNAFHPILLRLVPLPWLWPILSGLRCRSLEAWEKFKALFC